MNVLLIALPILAALLAATGTWLVGYSGIMNAGLTKRRDQHTAKVDDRRNDQEISSSLVTEALQIVGSLRDQIRYLREESASNEQQQLRNDQALRERIRILELRVNELELENTKLKVQLYDNINKQLNQFGGPPSPGGITGAAAIAVSQPPPVPPPIP